MTGEQWNLLSNIIHTYDAANSLQGLKTLFNLEPSVPIKMRVKTTFMRDYTQQCLATVDPIIKQSPHFQSLSPDARRTSITRNICWLSFIQSVLLSFQVDFLKDPRLTLSLIGTYGLDVFEKAIHIYQGIDQNETIQKLMFFVSTFYSNSSTVTFDSSSYISSTTASIDLVRVQDIYVTVLWKYLLYQYGFAGAVHHVSALMRTMLDSFWLLDRLDASELYEEAIIVTTKEMENSLVIHD